MKKHQNPTDILFVPKYTNVYSTRRVCHAFDVEPGKIARVPFVRFPVKKTRSHLMRDLQRYTSRVLSSTTNPRKQVSAVSVCNNQPCYRMFCWWKFAHFCWVWRYRWEIFASRHRLAIRHQIVTTTFPRLSQTGRDQICCASTSIYQVSSVPPSWMPSTSSTNERVLLKFNQFQSKMQHSTWL